MVKEYKKAGTVTHFYPKISVAVIVLTDILSVGDMVHFTRGGEDLFDQKITSIQVDHKDVQFGKKGEEIAIKADSKIKEGAEVLKIIS